jgi:hypothetical protein
MNQLSLANQHGGWGSDLAECAGGDQTLLNVQLLVWIGVACITP